MTDIFDTNKYAHDPRSDFLNWSLIDTGTFDYAADAWGFTYGTAIEWYQNRWTLRAGVFDLSIVPNSAQLDPGFRQFQLDFEIEERHDLWGQPGKLALTGYLSRGRMGSYNDAVQLAALTGGPADTAAVRRYTSRGGISLNAEQQVCLSWASSCAPGSPAAMSNPMNSQIRQDHSGRALAGWQAVEQAGRYFWHCRSDQRNFDKHKRYLDAGGLGILVGDGKLPHPGREYIVEAYYKMNIMPGLFVAPDLQYISNPAYNRDRGPTWIPGFRLHAEF